MQHVQRPRRELHPLQPDQPAREPGRAQAGVERVARHHPTDLRIGLKLTLQGLKAVGRQDGVGVDTEQVVIAVGHVLPPRQRQRTDLAVLVGDRLDHRHPTAERPGDLDRLVGAVIGDHHHPIRAPRLRQQRPDRRRDRVLLVVRRDHHHDLRRPVFGGRCWSRCSASCAASITRFTRAAKRSANGVAAGFAAGGRYTTNSAPACRLRRGRGRVRAGEPTPRRVRTPHPHRTRTSTLRAPEPPRRNLRLDLGLSRSGHDQQPGVKTPNPHEPNPHTTPARLAHPPKTRPPPRYNTHQPHARTRNRVPGRTRSGTGPRAGTPTALDSANAPTFRGQRLAGTARSVGGGRCKGVRDADARRLSPRRAVLDRHGAARPRGRGAVLPRVVRLGARGAHAARGAWGATSWPGSRAATSQRSAHSRRRARPCGRRTSG